MPQVQFVDSTPRKQEPTGVQEFFSNLGKQYKDSQDADTFGNLLKEYSQNVETAQALPELFAGIEQSNMSPSKRLQAMEQANALAKNVTEKDKALNARFSKQILSTEDRVKQKQNLENQGWPEHAAEQYLDATPGVKSTLQREHKELVERGFRTPVVDIEESKTTEEMGPNGEEVISQTEIQGFEPTDINSETLPKAVPPEGMTYAEKVKWGNENSKENNKLLQDTHKKRLAYKSNEQLIKSMQKTNDTGNLPSGLGKLLQVDKEGNVRPIAGLTGNVNKETQKYAKNLNQFLRGIKEQFGARITDFDIKAFMAQLPTLMNTEDGRRLILKEMDLVNQLDSLHNNELDKSLKHYGRNANYSDIQNLVDERVGNREKDLIERINLVSEASGFMDQMAKNQDKFKGTKLFEKDGKFKAVPEDKVQLAKEKGWRQY